MGSTKACRYETGGTQIKSTAQHAVDSWRFLMPAIMSCYHLCFRKPTSHIRTVTAVDFLLAWWSMEYWVPGVFFWWFSPVALSTSLAPCPQSFRRKPSSSFSGSKRACRNDIGMWDLSQTIFVHFPFNPAWNCCTFPSPWPIHFSEQVPWLILPTVSLLHCFFQERMED